MNTTIRPILIPFELRLKLLALFNRFDNRLPLVNVSLHYRIAYGKILMEELPKRCANLDQLFGALGDLFALTKMDGNVWHVRCFVRLDKLKYLAEVQSIRFELTSLKDIRPFFSADDFRCIEQIFEGTRREPIKSTQFEEKFLQLTDTYFNPLKYGFGKTPQMFLAFGDLFKLTTTGHQTLQASTDNYVLQASITNSLADIYIQLVAK